MPARFEYITATYSSAELRNLMEAWEDDLRRSLYRRFQVVDRLAVQTAKELASTRLSTDRDKTRSSRKSAPYRESFKAEVQRWGPRAKTLLSLVLLSDHPASYILEYGRSQDSYEIVPVNAKVLMWPDDNVSAVTKDNRRVSKGVTWTPRGGQNRVLPYSESTDEFGTHDVMEGYHVIRDALAITMDKALGATAGIGAGQVLSGRSGRKRRLPKAAGAGSTRR